MALSPVVFQRDSDEWMTPLALYREWDKQYHFTLDPCTTAENPLGAERKFTKEDDGLSQNWGGEVVFMNPPYSQIKAWMRKAYEESLKPKTIVVCLIPSRTDTAYWWDYVMKVWPHGIHFLRGRLKFGASTNSAPFPSVVVVFGRSE